MRPLPLPTRLLGSLGLAAACLAASPANAQEFEAGGPLHGVVLPLMPAQHGAPPGYPGVIPDLQVRDAKSNLLFTAEGLPPERQLYDGSVEHFRAYWFKYLPVKSFFDRQSLIRKWQAADLAPRQAEEYAEPIWWVPRHATERFTGRFNAPVPVVRARVENPVFTLDCGTLNPGLYAIRVVGAVSSNDIVRHRKPLVVRLTVNDGLQGEESVYRQRCKYVEEFYALAELYFHAPERRAYQATLTVEQGSQVDALIHTIDLHDALAGAERRAVKTRPTLTAPLANPPLATNDSARLARDAELWNAFVPINAQIGMTFGGGGDDAMVNRPNFGAGGLTPDEIRTRHGDWKPAPLGPVLASNQNLSADYTLADLAAARPLPDPYPFKDRGWGVYTPAAGDAIPRTGNPWPMPRATGSAPARTRS